MLIIDETKMDVRAYEEFVKRNEESRKAVQNKVEDLSNCLKATDNYLEKYQPFNAFT
jgi:hypothetical protein